MPFFLWVKRSSKLIPNELFLINQLWKFVTIISEKKPLVLHNSCHHICKLIFWCCLSAMECSTGWILPIIKKKSKSLSFFLLIRLLLWENLWENPAFFCMFQIPQPALSQCYKTLYCSTILEIHVSLKIKCFCTVFQSLDIRWRKVYTRILFVCR